MSGTLTTDPAMPGIGPFGYGVALNVAYDFGLTLAPGESLSGSVTLPPSIPAGFTRTLIGVAGTVVTVSELSPATPGNYVLPVPVTVLGSGGSSRPYERGARAIVFQR